MDLPEDTEATDTNMTQTALFLGRIHPKKGLLLLVEAWARTRPVGWELLIVGPDEGGHRSQVEKAINAAGLEKTIRFTGPLYGQSKVAALRRACLFILPTLSENFGMAVAEALAYGVPVLTTRGAPWPTLQTHGCGWWVAPTPEGVAQGLAAATSHAPETLRAMGAAGRCLIKEEFGWDRIAARFIGQYQSLVAVGGAKS
jgi:glycosyltransferase involved in cell wall biosynthesis